MARGTAGTPTDIVRWAHEPSDHLDPPDDVELEAMAALLTQRSTAVRRRSTAASDLRQHLASLELRRQAAQLMPVDTEERYAVARDLVATRARLEQADSDLEQEVARQLALWRAELRRSWQS